MAIVRLKNKTKLYSKVGQLVGSTDGKTFVLPSSSTPAIGRVLNVVAPGVIANVELLSATSTTTTSNSTTSASVTSSTATTGVKGDKGDKGDTGEKGEKGDTGPKGDTGERGATGLTGSQGIQGLTGLTGPAGSDATVTKAAVESVLTGEISTHTHASSSLTQQQILRLQ